MVLRSLAGPGLCPRMGLWLLKHHWREDRRKILSTYEIMKMPKCLYLRLAAKLFLLCFEDYSSDNIIQGANCRLVLPDLLAFTKRFCLPVAYTFIVELY